MGRPERRRRAASVIEARRRMAGRYSRYPMAGSRSHATGFQRRIRIGRGNGRVAIGRVATATWIRGSGFSRITTRSAPAGSHGCSPRARPIPPSETTPQTRLRQPGRPTACIWLCTRRPRLIRRSRASGRGWRRTCQRAAVPVARRRRQAAHPRTEPDGCVLAGRGLPLDSVQSVPMPTPRAGGWSFDVFVAEPGQCNLNILRVQE